MPFPRRLLNDYETVILDLHPHWWYYGVQALTLFGTMVGSIWLFGHTSGSFETVLQYPILIAIAASAGWLIVTVIKWRTTYFVVTSHRLIYRQGVVARDGVEIPLERVNNVNFAQSMFERIIGVGDLLIESGGKDGQQTFTDIARPEEVQNIIHGALQQRMSDGFEGAPSVGAMSVARELERLEALRDRGTLTEEEFEMEKRRILGR